MENKPTSIDNTTQIKFTISQLYQFIGIIIALVIFFLLQDKRLSTIDTRVENINLTLKGVYSKAEINEMKAAADLQHLELRNENNHQDLQIERINRHLGLDNK